MKVLLLAFLSLFVVLPSRAESDLRRQFSLSSAYFEPYLNSNEGMALLPLSLIQAYSKLFDITTDSFRDHWAKRLVNIVVEAPISYWIIPAFSLPYHELGHARVISAAGGYYYYGSHSFGHNIKNLNFWSLSGLRLITPSLGIPGGGIAYTIGKVNNAHVSPALTRAIGGDEGFSLIIFAGGINNQMLLAKKLATMSYENNGHFLYLGHYVNNKIHGFVYTLHDEDKNPNNDPKVNEGSDVGLIVRSYQKMGYSIERKDLKTLSLVTLLSGTTISYLRGYYNYLVNNDSVARPLELYGFRIPDINGYINSQGLSFEIESDYRIFPYLTVGLAYEFIWKGRFGQEFTPRARYNLASAFPVLNEMWLSCDLVIGSSVGGSLNIDYAPFPLSADNFWHRFSYFFDLQVHNAFTLYGQRNIVSIANGNTIATSAFAGFNLRY